MNISKIEKTIITLSPDEVKDIILKHLKIDSGTAEIEFGVKIGMDTDHVEVTVTDFK